MTMTPTQTIQLPADQLAEMLGAATTDVFTSMLGVDVQLETLPEEARAAPFDGVLSFIGLVGRVVGNGAVICTATTACDLSSRFLMTEFTHVDEQVLDAIGEITNMIVGGFKNLLEARLGTVHMSVPSVIHGKNISTSHLKADMAVAVLCRYSHGELRLKIALAATRE